MPSKYNHHLFIMKDTLGTPIETNVKYSQDDESSKETSHDTCREPTISLRISPDIPSEESSRQTISANSSFSSILATHPPPPPPPLPPPRKKSNKTPRVNNKKQEHARNSSPKESSSLQEITTKLQLLEASSSREDESSASPQFGQFFPSHISPRSVAFETELNSKQTVKDLQLRVNSLQGMVESLQQEQQATNNYLAKLFEQINLLSSQVKDQNEEKIILLGQLQQLSTQNYTSQETNKNLREHQPKFEKDNEEENYASSETILQSYLLSKPSNATRASQATKRGSLSESEIVSMIMNGVGEEGCNQANRRTTRNFSKAKRIQSKLYDRILENVLNDLETEVLEEDSSMPVPSNTPSVTSKQMRTMIREWRQIYQLDGESIEDYANRVSDTYLELLENDINIDENDLHFTFIMGLGDEFASIQNQAQIGLPDEWNVGEFADLVQVAQAYSKVEVSEEKEEEEEPATIRMFVRSLI